MPDRTLIERLDALSRVPFEGEAFRHMGPGYGPLDAEGARIHGGRWNPPNSFPVLYFALGRDTAGAEFYRVATRQGMPPENLLPRHLHRYRVRLARVADLSDSKALEQVGLSLADVRADDLSRCQAVGDAAHYLGFEAVQSPSATGAGEVLAVFFDRLGPGSAVEPLDFEVWDVLPPAPGA